MDAKGKDPVKNVEISAQVVLKILQHCTEALPQLVTGQLLGLDVGQTLEVTDCFAFPASVAAEEGDEDAAGANYQLDMMRCLREVNVDNNTVGWYQSATLGTFQTAELIETFMNYHENIRKCVCLIYDPHRSARGALALRAIRLKDSFIDLFKQDKLTGRDLVTQGITWRDVFVDIPIKIVTPPLAQALVAELATDNTATAQDVDRLSLSMQPFVERSVQSLLDCVDDMLAEQTKVTMYHKNVARQSQQFAVWLAKRRQENIARRAAGEEPLPEEDPLQFRPIPEPSLLDPYLIMSQMATFCDQVNTAGAATLEKLYVMEALQKAAV